MTHRQAHAPRLYVWPNDGTGDRLELDADVIGVRATRSVNGPMGQFSVNLLPRTRDGRSADLKRTATLYRKLRRPNAVVSIGFTEPGGIMLGLTNGVSRNRQLAGRTGGYGLTISGSDLGKCLVQDNLVEGSLTTPAWPDFVEKVTAALGPQHPAVRLLPGVWGPKGGHVTSEGTRDPAPTTLLKSVADVVTWALENAPSMHLPVLAKVLGGEGKVAEFIRTDRSITTWNDGRINSDTLKHYNGTVYNFILGCVDADFYEVWLDTTPNGTPKPDVDLIIRPKPFDERILEECGLPVAEETGSTWEDLRTRLDGLQHHEFRNHDLLSEQLGLSDDETFALYVVTAAFELMGSPTGLSRGLYYPAFDTFVAKHFGARAYKAGLQLLAGDMKARLEELQSLSIRFPTESIEFRNRLVNWYRYGWAMEKGVISVPGNDRYRPGDPVYLRDVEPAYGTQRGLRYYCHTVTWEWSFGGHYTCTLGLSRGHNDGVIRAAWEEIQADAPAASPLHIAATGLEG
jgi:hypothetical protein